MSKSRSLIILNVDKIKNYVMSHNVNKIVKKTVIVTELYLFLQCFKETVIRAWNRPNTLFDYNWKLIYHCSKLIFISIFNFSMPPLKHILIQLNNKHYWYRFNPYFSFILQSQNSWCVQNLSRRRKNFPIKFIISKFKNFFQNLSRRGKFAHLEEENLLWKFFKLVDLFWIHLK